MDSGDESVGEGRNRRRVCRQSWSGMREQVSERRKSDLHSTSPLSSTGAIRRGQKKNESRMATEETSMCVRRRTKEKQGENYQGAPGT